MSAEFLCDADKKLTRSVSEGERFKRLRSGDQCPVKHPPSLTLRMTYSLRYSLPASRCFCSRFHSHSRIGLAM